MRRAVLFLFLAALFALPVSAAIPSSEKEWYTPGDDWKQEPVEGDLYYGKDKSGKFRDPIKVTVDKNGNIENSAEIDGVIDATGNYALKTAYEALKVALIESMEVERLQAEIEKLAENLYGIFSPNGISVDVEKTAADGSTVTIKRTLKLKDGDNGVTGETTDPIPWNLLPDGKTLNWTDKGANGQIQLHNAEYASTVYSLYPFWAGAGEYIPFLANGRLIWRKFGGTDEDEFAYEDGVDGKQLELKNFRNTDEYEHSTLSRLLKEQDADAATLRAALDVIVRKKIAGSGSAPATISYLPLGDVLGGLGYPPDGVSIEDYIDGSSTNLAIKGWHADVRYLKPLSALITRPEDASAEPDDPEVVVVAKCHYRNGSNELAYVELGSLYGVTWATNWTEAVEHVTNTHEIVNWMTNWVYHTQYVTNYEDIVRVTTNAVYHESFITNTWNHENFITNTWNHENFITNTWNHENFITNVWNHENFITNVWNHENFITNTWNHESFITNTWNHENFITNAITQLNTIVNWQVVTNYIVRHMGGATPGAGGGEVAPPPVDPEDDPYSPEYEEDPVDKYILPVKNARIINAMTNRLFSAVDPGGALDFASLYTNDAARAEISGFYLAETNQLPIKAEIAPGIYGVDWVDYPDELIKMTSGNIKQIFRWWQQHSGVTNLLANIITNHEALAEMKTNLWSRVKVETLLDNQSVWTNGARRIEVKGFCNAPENTYPVKSIDLVSESGTILWEPVAIPDSSVVFAQETEHYIFNRSLLRSDGYGKNSVTNVWSLYGFEDAKEGQVPSAHYDEDGNKELKWGLTGAALRVVGTDGTSRIVGGGAARTNTVNFASAPDSNVKVSVSGNNPDEITVTIGVYYLTESNLSGGNSGGSGL